MENLKTIKITSKIYLELNKFNSIGISIGFYKDLFYIQIHKYMIKIH